MDKSNLTLKQQIIVRRLVNKLANGPIQLFFWGYQPNQITFSDSDPDCIEAQMLDLRAIEAERYIAIFDHNRANQAKGRLYPEAIRAVSGNFGLRKRDTVLRAIFDLSDGDPDREIGHAAVTALTGLSTKDVSIGVQLLAKEKLIVIQPFLTWTVSGGDELPSAHTEPEPEPIYLITPSGVAAIEDPPAAPHAAGTHVQIHGGNIGAINAAPYSHAQVTQNIGTDELASELTKLTADLINGLAEYLPAEFESIREEIDEIRSQVEDAPGDASGVIQTTKKIIDKIGGTMDWGTAKVEQVARFGGAMARLYGYLAAASELYRRWRG